MTDNRYQYQPRLVKLYRWLRWVPLHYLTASLKTLWWFVRGCPRCVWVDMETLRGLGNQPAGLAIVTETRWQTLRGIWSQSRAMAEYRMGHYYTSKEVLGK